MITEPGKVDPRVLEMTEKHKEQLELAAKELAEGVATQLGEALAAKGEPPLSAREAMIVGGIVGLVSQIAFQTTITAVLAVGDAFDDAMKEAQEGAEGTTGG